MVDNIKDVFRIMYGYMGAGFLLPLYGAALVYLFAAEKDRVRRLILCWLSLALLLIYICPVYYRIYVLKLDSHGTYYRMLWLLPVTVTVGYASCKLIGAHRRIGAAVICAILIICGSFTYTSADNTRAENAYHIPQYVIDLADHMVQDIPEVNVYACVPLEMLFYLRQYDADICLVYGREAVEPAWGYYNEMYEAFELSEVLDWNEVLRLTRDESLGVGTATYFAVASDREMNADPVEFGLEKVAESGNYILYADRVAQAHVREILKGTPYLE
ncbi:MAG: hypothetical protein IJ058_12455 [Lachnospiraceae bacterium]|nr:hypothetical protein [Lachnospiraceae bacterium]